jgi:NAD(P)-dependent dehydrogenase (short-subunit alcohol dehydrogenase family)
MKGVWVGLGFGGMAGVVSNAGIITFSPVEFHDMANIRDIFEVSLVVKYVALQASIAADRRETSLSFYVVLIREDGLHLRAQVNVFGAIRVIQEFLDLVRRDKVNNHPCAPQDRAAHSCMRIVLSPG